MHTVLHRAETRGHVKHGWLDSYHTFSFGNYYDPMRVHFGALRVLNDDVVSGGNGFGTHSHDNMEIISIPLSGDLEHKDSLNNVAVIKQNDIQILSAGTGISHSEFNKNKDRDVNFLQIWVFPKKRNTTPFYDQKTFSPEERINKFQLIVSPDHEKDSVVINQDAWFYLGSLKRGFKTDYIINQPGNGLYAFLINGKSKVFGQQLNKRDGLGVWDSETISVESEEDSEMLLIEVPMI
jgi:quercetin 2,3-dioxygenase